MSIYKGTDFCTIDSIGYEGRFEHDRGSETLIIKDNLISTVAVGQERARVELLKGGYSERWVTIKTVHTPNLKQNDIITFKSLNWIVKEITLDFSAPTLIQTLKGLRYE